uniref:MFS domain-containing protein n=1 Tax=Strongyloides papillosus TaxID=174720 RepID=A0A0N5BN69_STREA
MKLKEKDVNNITWNLFYYMILHGTLGNIGNILNYISIIYEVDIKNFVTTQNGTSNMTISKEDVDNYAFSSFALSSIFGQLFICLIYHMLVERYGSSFLWINVRHYIVMVACSLMIITKYLGTPLFLTISQFLFGANSFFIFPQLVFLSECGPFNKRANVILNTSTAFMFINVIIITLTSKTIINYDNWHYIFVIGIISSITYLLLVQDVKETPKYLYFTDQNFEKINESLLFYRHDNTNVDKIIDEFETEMSMYKTRVFMSINEVINIKGLRKRIFILFVAEISQKISLYIILSPYLEKILNYLDVPLLYTSSVLVGIQFGGLIASSLSSTVSNLFSRKRLLIAFIILSGISFKLMFLGLVFENIIDDKVLPQILCILAIYISTIISNIGHSYMTPILVNDIIPIHAKVATIQILTIFSCIIQIYLIISFVPFYNFFGSVTFLNYNLVMTIAMFLIAKYLPDTKEKQVYEVFNDYEEL